MERDVRLHSLERAQWIVFAILCLGSLIFWDVKVTAGVLLGGIVVIANFKILRRIVEKSFSEEGKTKSFLAIFGIKFLGLMTVVTLIAFMLREVINLLAFLVGLLTVFLTVAVEGMRGLRDMQGEDKK